MTNTESPWAEGDALAVLSRPWMNKPRTAPIACLALIYRKQGITGVQPLKDKISSHLGVMPPSQLALLCTAMGDDEDAPTVGFAGTPPGREKCPPNQPQGKVR